MDTTQKNREQVRRPREPEQQTRKRPAAPEHTEERSQQKRPAPRPAKPAGEKPRAKTQAPVNKKVRRQEEDDTLSSKRRAYGNSKPKKKSGISSLSGAVKQTIRRNSAKAKARKVEKGHHHPQQPTPAVIYTEPKVFNRNRFAAQLLTVAGVVLAMVLGLSVFFKVKTITVSGAEVYSAWAIREASGISEGDNLLSFGNARAGAMIKANLPYVSKVRIGIKLPDTVNIIVKEEEVVYAIKAQDGIWWLMTSDGRIVEQSNGGKASSYTQILGVTLDNPVQNEKAIATENVPAQTLAEGQETAPAAVTGAQRLRAALEIVKALEANDIVGDAASVDVSSIENIVLWYGTRYQVKLGDDSRLTEKIAYMNDAILQLSDYQSGNLDLSFTIWPDKVVYTPFG